MRSHSIVSGAPAAPATWPEPHRFDSGIRSSPDRLYAAALFLGFVVAWTLYFSITEAPFAIKHDMAEAYAWGQEFQLGYNQHPPVWAWICGIWFSILPRTEWAFAMLSAVNAAIGLVGAWLLIGDFTSGRKRLAAWALLLVTPFYTMYAYKYDADTIFLSVWPWTLHAFLKSLQSRRLSDAVALGVTVAIAILCKYYAAILIASCFLAGLQHPAWRRYIRSAAPYVSGLLALALFVPHIVWLVAHQAPPLRYLAGRSFLGWGLILGLAARTLLSSVGSSLGPVFVIGWIVRTARQRPTSNGGDALRQPFGVLATLALAPVALTLLAALILRTRVTPDMAVGTFSLVPLLMIEVAGIADTDRLARIGSRLAIIVTVIMVVLSPAIAAVRVWRGPSGVEGSPFQEVAARATRLWHERTGLPLAYVGGSDWYENAVVFYSSDRPHAFVHFDYARNLWVTPAAIAAHGLLSVCLESDQRCLTETAPFMTPASTRVSETITHRRFGLVGKPMQFVFTVIPPSR